mgnify:CR=1 FL=1
MKIVSGKTGTPHVTSQQFRQILEGTIGQDSYILTSGENLEPELSTNNLLKIKSGMMSHHGNVSSVELGTYDEVTIANGSQGMKRIDLIVNRYSRNEGTGVEQNSWAVIQGTPAASSPAVPSYTVGNLQEGDLVDDCPVFEVHLDGINVTEVKKLLSVTENMSTLNADLAELSAKTAGYVYSTAETVIGKWTDGRNLYRKVFNIGNLRANKNQTYVAHRINNFDRAIHLYGSARNQSLESRFTLGLPLPAAGNATMEMSLHANATNVYIYHNAEATVSNYSAVVVMEYIKTVD